MIPLGFLSPLPQPPAHIKAVPSTKKGKEESELATKIQKSFDRMLRKSYLLVTIFSFGSELLAVIWSTVAVNQLTETVVAPAESVWALLKRDWYDLAWSATNSHFLFGTLRCPSNFGLLFPHRSNLLLLREKACLVSCGWSGPAPT